MSPGTRLVVGSWEELGTHASAVRRAVFIDEQGRLHSQQCVATVRHTPCIFEYVYFARPDGQDLRTPPMLATEVEIALFRPAA